MRDFILTQKPECPIFKGDGVENMGSDPNRYPAGWNAARVKAVLAHYEKQTDDEAVAEDEAAFEDKTRTFIEIPNALVPKVRELIAKFGS